MRNFGEGFEVSLPIKKCPFFFFFGVTFLGSPPEFVVVAHHPLDVDEFVPQGLGFPLLVLVLGALGTFGDI